MSLSTIVHNWLSAMQRSPLRALLVIGGAVLVIGLLAPHAKLKPDEMGWMTPNGILELELAGTRDGAIAIVRTWSEKGLAADAKHAIYWDFPLIAAYTFLIYVAIHYLSGSIRPQPTLLDRFTVRSILLAAVCDCIENVGMLSILAAAHSPAPGWIGAASTVTAVVSLVKWTLLFICSGHIAWLLGLYIAHHGWRTRGGCPPQ